MNESLPQQMRARFGQRVLDRALVDGRSSLRRATDHYVLAATRRAMRGRRDPVVARQVGGVTIDLPLSHRLPDYLARHPNYGANIVRLAEHLAVVEPDLVVIDVGANVGDTVALLRGATRAPVLCIEADERYFGLLKTNAPVLGDVECVQTFLGRRAEVVLGTMHATCGTGHLVASASALHVQPLDEVLDVHARFARARLLKIDVDGVDFEVLAGAVELLRNARPALFLEYDPTLVSAQGFDARAALDWLRDEGYGPFVAYDNLGDMALTGSLADARLLDDLHDYAAAKHSSTFWDLAVFHRDDEASFSAFASAERAWRAASSLR